MKSRDKKKYSTPRREIFVFTLEKLTHITLFFITLVFIIYIFEIIDARIPIRELDNHWHKPARELLASNGLRPGWDWLKLLHKSDFINLAGIAFLASVTTMSYLRLLPVLIKEKNKILAVIAVLEILVLVLAASGLISV
jgi:hypothetical protein